MPSKKDTRTPKPTRVSLEFSPDKPVLPPDKPVMTTSPATTITATMSNLDSKLPATPFIEPDDFLIEEEEEYPDVWKYALNTLLRFGPSHPQGHDIRLWLKYQRMNDMEEFFFWKETDFTLNSPYTEFLSVPGDRDSIDFLRNNSVIQLHMLWKYLHHIAYDQGLSSNSN